VSATGGSSGSSSEVFLQPSGGDDTQAIRDALWQGKIVRLASGTFSVSDVIDVPEGVRIVGAGSGSAGQSGTKRTLIQKADFPETVFRFGNFTQFAALESLRIKGPGKTVGLQNTAIKC